MAITASATTEQPPYFEAAAAPAAPAAINTVIAAATAFQHRFFIFGLRSAFFHSLYHLRRKMQSGTGKSRPYR